MAPDFLKKILPVLAPEKVGAVQECVLRKSLMKDGQYLDQVLYAMVDLDWRRSRETHAVFSVQVH